MTRARSTDRPRRSRYGALLVAYHQLFVKAECCARCRARELVFAVGWAAFWIYWLVAAFSMKRGRVPWSRELGIRGAIVVVVIVLVRLRVFRGHGLSSDPSM